MNSHPRSEGQEMAEIQAELVGSIIPLSAKHSFHNLFEGGGMFISAFYIPIAQYSANGIPVPGVTEPELWLVH